MIKLNVDVTLFKDLEVIGVGMIIRDDLEGWCMTALESKTKTRWSHAYTVELLAIREGLEFAMACDIHVDFIESNCFNAVQEVEQGKKAFSNNVIANDIESLFSSADVVSHLLFCLIRQSTNLASPILVWLVQ
ncbi:hypothetical protein TorRG33x02_296380 [Trema orientale]|uniref:RNase H type-1 domain-containing protein n=1 Tax=Trema orientale TaxID=63057 RepID=A0A2P5C5X3_TREOI|nr:hypothetical protein TorRG33x02_296380 [Trema orientale]